MQLYSVELDHEFELVLDQRCHLIINTSSIKGTKLVKKLTKGNTFKQKIDIQYNTSQIPYFYQKLNLKLRNPTTGQVASSTPIYVFFTPHNTVEVWNDLDFENTKRIWDDPEVNPTVQKIYIKKQNIPQSNLSDADFHNSEMEKSYVSMEGLAYSIPVYKVIESDTVEDFEEEDIIIPNNNKGNGYGKSLNYTPQEVNKKSSNFRIWLGTITGNIRTAVENDLAACSGGSLGLIDIPIWDIKITLMDKDNVGFGCFGVDDKLAEGYSDKQGNFALSFISKQRYKGGLFGCAREGDALELYLIIDARNGGNTIRVVKRLGGTRDITISKSNPMDYNYWDTQRSFGTVFPSSSGVKAQLLGWANHCREFANTVYGLPGSRDPLEIMIAPFSQSGGAFFFPAGYKAKVLGLSALASFLLTPVGVLSNYFSNKDCIYMGEDNELDEDFTYHEFGHYFMWHLQDKSWLNPLEASFADHGIKYNAENVRIAWTEGWAEGFSQIADAQFRSLDNESGFNNYCNSGNQTIITDYELRRYDKRNPENYELANVERNGTTSLESVMTHGYVSELNIGAILYDLYDGNALDNDGNRIIIGSSPQISVPNDQVTLTLAEICQPILNNRGTGGFINQGNHLINHIVQYFAELRKLHGCNKDRGLADLFMFDKISDFATPSQHILNTDAISNIVTIGFEQFKDKDFNQYKYKGSESETFTLDNNALPSALLSFNFGSSIANGEATISDNLTVSNNALLSFNRNLPIGYAFIPNGGIPLQGSTLDVDVCGQMRLNVQQNGKVELGDNTGGYKAKVKIGNAGLFHFHNESTLTINNESDLIVKSGGTLVIRSGAILNVLGTGKIKVEAGGYICIESGAVLNFSPQSELYIDPLAVIGTNPLAEVNGVTCSNTFSICNITGGNPTIVLTNSEALRFDGTTTVVEVADQAKLNFATNPFTFEAIIQSSHTGGFGNIEAILSKRSFVSGSVSDGFIFGIWSGGQLFVQAAGAPNILDNNIAFGYNLYDGQCHHVALTRTGNTLQFFVDGNPTGAFLTGRNISSTGNMLRIGRNGLSGLFYNGLIGEIRLWNLTRTTSEIQSNINTPVGTLQGQGGLVALWDMKDGTQALSDLSGFLPLANGVLGFSAASETIDPQWVSSCSINCTTPGISNFRIGQFNEEATGKVDGGQLQIEAYPNPFSDGLTIFISSNHEKTKIKITNVNGFEVYSENSIPSNTIIEVGQDLPSGLYFVHFNSGGESKVIKIVKI